MQRCQLQLLLFLIKLERKSENFYMIFCCSLHNQKLLRLHNLIMKSGSGVIKLKFFKPWESITETYSKHISLIFSILSYRLCSYPSIQPCQWQTLQLIFQEKKFFLDPEQKWGHGYNITNIPGRRTSGRHNTQNNDAEHNNSQYNYNQNSNSQYNDSRHNYILHNYSMITA